MVAPRPTPVGHTCPDIDQVIRRVRQLHWRVKNPEHGGEDELLKEALELLEVLRESNQQLRANAAHYEKGAKESEKKFLRVLHQLSSGGSR